MIEREQCEMEDGLKLMRGAFPAHHIGILIKGSKEQTKCPANEKTSCKVCGGWHHPKMAHLSYVGHAALTDRLLDCDPFWTWEPLAYDSFGLPAFDSDGGLWIKLTVCGVTRLGYGNAMVSEFKEIGSRQKEVIGDALRNAAMRFGAALELWHKGELHLDDDDPRTENKTTKPPIKQAELPPYTAAQMDANKPLWEKAIQSGKSSPEHLISTVSAKYSLSDEQKKIICGMADKSADKNINIDVPPLDAEWLRDYERGAQ